MSGNFRTEKFRTGLSRDRVLAEKHCKEYEEQLNTYPAPWKIVAKAKFSGILALLQRDSEKLEDAWKKWENLVDCIDNDTERAAEENLFNEWKSKEEFEDLMDKLDQYSGEIQSYMQAVWTHSTPAPSARVSTSPPSLQTPIVPPVQDLNNYNVPAPVAPAQEPVKPKVKEVSKTATPPPVSSQPPPPPLAVVADIKDNLATVSEIKESAATTIDAVEEKTAPILSSVKDTVAAVIPVLEKEVFPTANVSTACSATPAEIPQTLAAAVPTIGSSVSDCEKANNDYDKNTGSSQFVPPGPFVPAALKIISEEWQKDCRWLNGSEFLKEPREKWPNNPDLALDLTPTVATLVSNSNDIVRRNFSETSDQTAVSASSQPSATAITAQNSDKDKEQLSKVAVIPAAPATSYPPQLQQPQTLFAQQQPPPLQPSTSPPIQSQGSRPYSPRATTPPALCVNPNKAVFTTATGIIVDRPIWFCWRVWLDRKMGLGEGFMEAGLKDNIDIKFLDYRKDIGIYDKIISIKMIEAVGHEYFPVYFSTIRDRLRPGGIAAIQAIYCFTEMYKAIRKLSNFIKKHNFPGGEMPSVGMINASLPAGITMSKEYNRIGKHYSVTLDLWNAIWPEHRQKIAALGYSDRFIRKWEFYFGFCSALFEYGNETADPSYMPSTSAGREGLVEKYEKTQQHLLIYFLLFIYVSS